MTRFNLITSDGEKSLRRVEELQRERRLEAVRRAGAEEIRLADLRRTVGMLEHADGRFFIQSHGELDAAYVGHIAAYAVNAAGDLIVFEAPTGVKSRQELQERRAERERRRAEQAAVVAAARRDARR